MAVAAGQARRDGNGAIFGDNGGGVHKSAGGGVGDGVIVGEGEGANAAIVEYAILGDAAHGIVDVNVAYKGTIEREREEATASVGDDVVAGDGHLVSDNPNVIIERGGLIGMIGLAAHVEI